MAFLVLPNVGTVDNLLPGFGHIHISIIYPLEEFSNSVLLSFPIKKVSFWQSPYLSLQAQKKKTHHKTGQICIKQPHVDWSFWEDSEHYYPTRSSDIFFW